ncbi:TcdA/TcdB catalytic glycosyltransferase domain-containing protein [Streptomyces sp. PSKA30]|uniref:TcdA/TcdB catalytic glycosyltransferase domain-containing protein n=1 Tax=Streptomyces sp. PSKA30 TaxID=2874597 RepID=UPI001CD0C402|nr:TcdA/TcdB catalytic glycosyltransferase domain-containing protein [Streptomyces sp. PSKA30]MBZ9639544.1 hypothetical protein [Streptomyces sp. PSKA30]
MAASPNLFPDELLAQPPADAAQTQVPWGPGGGDNFPFIGMAHTDDAMHNGLTRALADAKAATSPDPLLIQRLEKALGTWTDDQLTSRGITKEEEDPTAQTRSAVADDLQRILYANSAEEFDDRLGRYLIQRPEALAAARHAVLTVLRILETESPYLIPLMGNDLRKKSPRSGDVGNNIDVLREVSASGNLRELSGMLFHTVASEALDDIIEVPSYEDFPWLKRERNWRRSIARTYAEFSVEDLSPPLSPREAAVANLVFRDGKQYARWERGNDAAYMRLEAPLHKDGQRTGGLVASGSSGSIILIMESLYRLQESRQVEFDLAEVRLGLMGAMLVGGHHTAHELMRTTALWPHAEQYGFAYEDNWSRYRYLAPLTEAELRQNVADNGLFPDEIALGILQEDFEYDVPAASGRDLFNALGLSATRWSGQLERDESGKMLPAWYPQSPEQPATRLEAWAQHWHARQNLMIALEQTNIPSASRHNNQDERNRINVLVQKRREEMDNAEELVRKMGHDPALLIRRFTQWVTDEYNAAHAKEQGAPTAPSPFVGMALIESDTTDALNQQILQAQVSRLSPGSPGHTRVQAVLNSYSRRVFSVPFLRGERDDLSPEGQAGVAEIARAVVDAGKENWSRGMPVPKTEVVGQGNGKFGWRSSSAAETAGMRAAVTARQLRGQIRDLLRQSSAGAPDPEYFDVTHRAAERPGGRAAEVVVDFRPRKIVLGGTGPDRVPKVLHFVWLGGEMRPGARQNLDQWVSRAAESGWSVQVWTDQSARNSNTGFLHALTSLGGEVKTIDETFFNGHSGTEAALADKLRRLFTVALQNKARAMASDIARYELVYRYGGAYLDVDIAPGGIRLPAQPFSMDRNSVPLFAPELPYAETLRSTIEDMDRELLERGAPVPDRDHGQALADAVRWKYDRGDLNNSLIVAPPQNTFLYRALQNLPDPEDPKFAALAAKGILLRKTAALTGPWFIKGQIKSELHKAFGVGPQGYGFADRNDSYQAYYRAFAQNYIAFDHGHREAWARVAWLTEESEVRHDASVRAVEAFGRAVGEPSGTHPASSRSAGAEPAGHLGFDPAVRVADTGDSMRQGLERALADARGAVQSDPRRIEQLETALASWSPRSTRESTTGTAEHDDAVPAEGIAHSGQAVLSEQTHAEPGPRAGRLGTRRTTAPARPAHTPKATEASAIRATGASQEQAPQASVPKVIAEQPIAPVEQTGKHAQPTTGPRPGQPIADETQATRLHTTAEEPVQDSIPINAPVITAADAASPEPAPGDLLREAFEVMSGRHQAAPLIRGDAVAGYAEEEDLAVCDDTAAHIADGPQAEARPDLPR